MAAVVGTSFDVLGGRWGERQHFGGDGEFGVYDLGTSWIPNTI